MSACMTHFNPHPPPPPQSLHPPFHHPNGSVFPSSVEPLPPQNIKKVNIKMFCVVKWSNESPMRNFPQIFYTCTLPQSLKMKVYESMLTVWFLWDSLVQICSPFFDGICDWFLDISIRTCPWCMPPCKYHTTFFFYLPPHSSCLTFLPKVP